MTTKFKLRDPQGYQRVPRFRQIIQYSDTIAGLGADGADAGRVWVFIPAAADAGAEGWWELPTVEIDRIEEPNA